MRETAAEWLDHNGKATVMVDGHALVVGDIVVGGEGEIWNNQACYRLHPAIKVNDGRDGYGLAFSLKTLDGNEVNPRWFPRGSAWRIVSREPTHNEWGEVAP